MSSSFSHSSLLMADARGVAFISCSAGGARDVDEGIGSGRVGLNFGSAGS